MSNIPSEGNGNALSCAEMAIFLILACLRSVNAMADSITHGRVGVPLGNTLLGKTVLIVGFGHIAKELVPRLKPFGARLAVLRRGEWGNSALEHVLDERWDWNLFASRASEIDIIVLTCTLNPSTAGLVNKAFLKHCRTGVHIVNVARGTATHCHPIHIFRLGILALASHLHWATACSPTACWFTLYGQMYILEAHHNKSPQCNLFGTVNHFNSRQCRPNACVDLGLCAEQVAC